MLRRMTERLGFLWALAVFLLGYAVLLIAVSHFYLLPAYRALGEIDPDQRTQLRAMSLLLLAVLLVVLVVGLLLTFRMRRYFVGSEQSGPTRYPDAWSESAKRMKTPREE